MLGFPRVAKPARHGAPAGGQECPPHMIYLRGSLFACRWRVARAPAGPVPVGGLRMPFSKSFRTTALLRSSFFEANNRVSGFLPRARR
jgi:hypothetical protein